MISNSKILITGGTGSLGFELSRQLCASNEVVVYSRNEERQYEMKQKLDSPRVSYRIGDVRDTTTLQRALVGCNFAIHAAAMKDVVMCEDQPTQAVLNNIEGSRSFLEAVRNSEIRRAVAVSTDKAAAPANVYGATKYIMEKLFTEASAGNPAVLCSVRFGNMIDSRGSLISIWKQNPKMDIKLNHPEIARFFFSVSEAAETVLTALEKGAAGEIYIRKMKQAKIIDILRLITGKKDFQIQGLFPGEKLHEDLVSAGEAPYCWEEGDYYVVRMNRLNPKPIDVYNTRNAAAFSEAELKKLIFG